jgi:nucleoid DNA-binding protein
MSLSGLQRYNKKTFLQIFLYVFLRIFVFIITAKEMDIDLFSNIVKDLILDNDEVTLPGLGTFVSELMPSSFSDKGYTINPPYRRLSFRQRWKEDDSLLVDFYSATNGIEKSQAAEIVGEFVSGLKETLQSKKLIVLPGLGRLRATKENAFFFIADEDLDIYPGGFGLEPVSLKTHEETPEEVTAVVKELQEALSEDEAVKTVKAVEAVESPRKRRPWLLAVLGTVASVVLFLGLFMLLARIAPDFIDKILYTEEELRIINY